MLANLPDAYTVSLAVTKQLDFGYCDTIAREKDERCHKRGAQATWNVETAYRNIQKQNVYARKGLALPPYTRYSLRGDCPAGLTSPAFHACGSACRKIFVNAAVAVVITYP